MAYNLAAVAVSSMAGGAFAQNEADYGFEFVTIGDPGNRDTNDDETDYPGQRIGRVDYEYRMAITEVTLGQYFEFVVAYLPLYERNTGNIFGFPQFTGFGIRTWKGEANIRSGHSVNEAANMSWEYAARYVNWLHNGKNIEEWAFETGPYDTSTFTENKDGSSNHQIAHSPNALFWIPTSNEWVKAAYWDPNKNNGDGGYWRFQNGSDIEPIPSLFPEEGGERNAGPLGDEWPLNVASFQSVRSPWGMYDMAGGEAEFLEQISNGNQGRRFVAGTSHAQSEYGDIFSNDVICFHRAIGMTGVEGLRLASAVLSPADLNEDGHVNYFDISVFIQRFIAGDLRVDFDGDEELDIEDVLIFLELMAMR